MPGIARTGQDSAGGVQLGGRNSTVFVNGARAVVRGDPVQGHGPFPHSGPTMAGASGTVFIGGIGVCRAGDSATCGHPTSGSGSVSAG